jgi:hypothetical protein
LQLWARNGNSRTQTVQIRITIGPGENAAQQNVDSRGNIVDTRISSFYTPFYAGIENNWYKNPALDSVWKPEYDVLVEQLVETHAPYILPFARDVLRVVDKQNNTHFATEDGRLDYYILSRAYQMPHTRQKWLDALESEKGRGFVCPICKAQIPVLSLQPDLVAQYGTHPPSCRTCSYVVRRYTPVWGEDTKRRLNDLMSHLSVTRNCDICRLPFSLERHVFTYAPIGGAGDLLYPNLYANICCGCFKRAFHGYKRGSRATHAKRLYELFVLIGKVPTTNFNYLLYLFHDREGIMKYISLLKKMPFPYQYVKEFGSLFAALVAAGVFPKGSKRMALGTMILANDGHLCLSMAEKEIDDFLFEAGIQHNKEVSYPDSGYRADWELFGSVTRTFVEYFGLMSKTTYAEKAKLKADIALAHGIELIAIYPRTDWRSAMTSWNAQRLKIG